MYGLPEDADLTFLMSRQLEMVCLGLSVVILNFDENISISIENTFYHYSADGKCTACESHRDSALALSGVLGCSITGVSWHTNGFLRMSFSNGEDLELRDDTSLYEAYQIRHGDKLIVV